MKVTTKTDIKEFPLLNRGKVRDIYDIDDSTLLIVTTDRMSAFDVIMNEPVPYKGVILNQITLFWMKKFAHLVKNHLIESDEDIAAAAALVKEKWGSVDVLVHSVAFANREDLTKRFIETSRDGFATALNVSAYSLTALCHAFEPMLNPGASVLTMTYYGAQKIITNYNVMGVAKAALEASVRYLSVDLGAKDVRINAISAGPLKTLASSGISDFKQIFNHIEEHAPLRRNVTTEDVGKAAVFLASDLGSAVTGEIMFVDCGYNNLGI